MQVPLTRRAEIERLFPKAPAFRLRQIDEALFQRGKTGWKDLTTLPTVMRETLEKEVPWISVSLDTVLRSRNGDTYKAIIRACDDLRFESVLMENKRGQWTICVSSQVGCAMGCVFCATGKMGLKRNLSSDEIADQYRLWQGFLAKNPDLPQRISNVVFMGMGEPLGNYAALKDAIHLWIDWTDLGPTRITVSSVGVLPNLNRLLTDPGWPPVRLAISLHSANQEKRQEIVPTTTPRFLEDLAKWSKEYLAILGNRRHHITFEYTLIEGVNDSPEHAKELAAYMRRTGATLLNVIPWNPVPGTPFARSTQGRIDAFKKILLDGGIDVTQRKTMGDDIAAACGQLVTEEQGKLRIPLA